MPPILHVYTNGSWKKIAEFPPYPTSNITSNSAQCPNCSAPIKGPKCEYCDTIHYNIVNKIT